MEMSRGNKEVPNPNEADLPINFEFETNFITIKQQDSKDSTEFIRQTLEPRIDSLDSTPTESPVTAIKKDLTKSGESFSNSVTPP